MLKTLLMALVFTAVTGSLAYGDQTEEKAICPFSKQFRTATGGGVKKLVVTANGTVKSETTLANGLVK